MVSDTDIDNTCIRLYLQCRKIHGPITEFCPPHLHHPGPMKRMLFHGPVKYLGVQSNAYNMVPVDFNATFRHGALQPIFQSY